jgi:hypothetical protein
MIMVVKIGRVLAAVVVMSILLVHVRPAVCGNVILNPVSSVSKSVTKTTKKVANTSVSTVKTVVSAPFNLLSKIGKTVTGKK